MKLDVFPDFNIEKIPYNSKDKADWIEHKDLCTALRTIAFHMGTASNTLENIANNRMKQLTIEEVFAERYHEELYKTMVQQMEDDFILKKKAGVIPPEQKFMPPPYEPLPKTNDEFKMKIKDIMLSLSPKLKEQAQAIDYIVDVYCSPRY